MLLGCCHCGPEGSQSVASSALASVSAGSVAFGSSLAFSASSEITSSVGDSAPIYDECQNCMGGVSPSVYEFTWAIQNNCPWDPPYLPNVGCYDQFNSPVQLSRASFVWPPYFGVQMPVGTCLWQSTSVGGVSVDGEGQCSPRPLIQLAIGVTDDGLYFAILYITWYGPYNPSDPMQPVTVMGILEYSKTWGLPPNCLNSIELDFAIAGGNFEEPPNDGDGYGVAYGPGCNVAWGNNVTVGNSTFPSTVTIAPMP